MKKSFGAMVMALLFFVMTAELSAQGSGGRTGLALYVDGTLYRTVGTPTELPTNAPSHTFDVLYDLGGVQSYNVATVGPGDPGFNGGRWEVHSITFTSYAEALSQFDSNLSGDFDSDEEVEAALAAGAATDAGIVRRFVCPVIRA